MIPEFQHKPSKRLTYAQKVRAGEVNAKPRQRVNPVAKKRASKLKKYREWIRIAMHGVVRCANGGHLATRAMEPHHPYGRSGENLFKVIPLCSTCHTWVHEHPDSAYDLGWLQPEYRGVQRQANHPQPFKLLPPP